MSDSMVRVEQLAPLRVDGRFLDDVGVCSSSSLLRIARRVYEEEFIVSSRSANRKEKMKEVHILLPESLFLKAKEMATIQGMSLAELIRRSLAQGLGHDSYGLGFNIVQELQALREEVRALKEWKEKVEPVVYEGKGLRDMPRSSFSPSGDSLVGRGRGGRGASSSRGVVERAGRAHPVLVSSVGEYMKSGFLRSEKRSPYEGWVFEVMQTEPGRSWHWKEVLSLLEERGYRVKSNTLKDRMNRMSKEGLIVKVDRGTYALP